MSTGGFYRPEWSPCRSGIASDSHICISGFIHGKKLWKLSRGGSAVAGQIQGHKLRNFFSRRGALNSSKTSCLCFRTNFTKATKATANLALGWVKFSGHADSLIQMRGKRGCCSRESRPRPRMNIAWRLCVFSVDFHELSGLGKNNRRLFLLSGLLL